MHDAFCQLEERIVEFQLFRFDRDNIDIALDKRPCDNAR